MGYKETGDRMHPSAAHGSEKCPSMHGPSDAIKSTVKTIGISEQELTTQYYKHYLRMQSVKLGDKFQQV